MKQLVTILLFSLFLAQSFSSYLLIADYWLNKSFVAKNLCENREKPRMHCDGKCYLHKQLEKENKQDDNPPATIKVKIESIAFLIQEIPEHFFAFSNDAPSLYNRYKVFLVPGIANSVFHPPLAKGAS